MNAIVFILTNNYSDNADLVALSIIINIAVILFLIFTMFYLVVQCCCFYMCKLQRLMQLVMILKNHVMLHSAIK